MFPTPNSKSQSKNEMSDFVPFEIQVEIIKRVHLVESLIRFRSVSKQWKSLIDSSEFIAHHIVNQTQPQHLLVTYNVADDFKYASLVDDHSFPHHQFVPTVPPTVKLQVLMLDSSHGLVFLYGLAADLSTRNYSVVLWNPSIRKSVGIVLPFGSDVVGFGVCPKTCDPKIVTVRHRPYAIHPVEARVFTLSSRAWRIVSMNQPMPLKRIRFGYTQVLIDGVIHWLLYDWISGCSEMILSFDLTTEEFGEVYFPNSLAHHTNHISISKCKESLVLLDHDEDEEICDVWMMTKNGDFEYSFAKLYAVSFQVYDGCVPYGVNGFTKDGLPIREHGHPSGSDDDSMVTTLEAYEPSTGSIRDLGSFVGSKTRFRMTSYKESLLLLNHSDSIIQ